FIASFLIHFGATFKNPQYANYKLSDFGVPGYSCNAELMKPSKTIPSNVNAVRPADIKVVMALGDSITVTY
uniref:Triacylglycerol lipase n=1 Tax=Angiostrongylus cantonensis TaxID=6313 RepID=A0A0K0D7F5_ANGCA